MIHQAYAVESSASYAAQSSSGGAFMAILSEVFKTNKDVVVYGVELFHGHEVRYSEATTLKECERFRGSKYVESSILSLREEIKNRLEDGKYVVVSGLPCQVYALDKYLSSCEISKSNLLLIDLLCHGTPPNKIWRDYVEWLEKKYRSTLIDYSFRYKPAKWQNYPAMASFQNGKTVINSMEVRMFNSLFLSDLIMRECCYSCTFANTARVGDITLADFWGIREVLPEYKPSGAVSLVLSNTDKADSLLELLSKENNTKMMRCNNSDYIKYQHNLNKPVDRPEKRDVFLEDYNNKGFDYCVRKYMKYSVLGKCKFFLKKVLNEIGLVEFLRNRRIIR